MTTYFMRHKFSKEFNELTKKLSKEYLFIHFEDNLTLNSLKENAAVKDLKPEGLKALKRMEELGDNGGYIAVTYEFEKGKIFLGKVKKKTKITEKWMKVGSSKKLIKRMQVKLRAFWLLYYPVLGAVQPRGTISPWPSVNYVVENLIEKGKLPYDLKALAPAQLEVLCYEYMRKKKLLDCLLMPIGRTLPDIDVIGLNKKGKKVVAQVTQESHVKEIKKKKRKIKNYLQEREKADAYFFGPEEMARYITDGKIKFISIKKVFENFRNRPILDSMLKIRSRC